MRSCPDKKPGSWQPGDSRAGSKDPRVRRREKERPPGTPYNRSRDSSARSGIGNARSRDRSKDKYQTNHMTAQFGDESSEEEAEWNMQMYDLEHVGFGPSAPRPEQAPEPGNYFQLGPAEEQSAATGRITLPYPSPISRDRESMPVGEKEQTAGDLKKGKEPAADPGQRGQRTAIVEAKGQDRHCDLCPGNICRCQEGPLGEPTMAELFFPHEEEANEFDTGPPCKFCKPEATGEAGSYSQASGGDL